MKALIILLLAIDAGAYIMYAMFEETINIFQHDEYGMISGGKAFITVTLLLLLIFITCILINC